MPNRRLTDVRTGDVDTDTTLRGDNILPDQQFRELAVVGDVDRIAKRVDEVAIDIDRAGDVVAQNAGAAGVLNRPPGHFRLEMMQRTLSKLYSVRSGSVLDDRLIHTERIGHRQPPHSIQRGVEVMIDAVAEETLIPL